MGLVQRCFIGNAIASMFLSCVKGSHFNLPLEADVFLLCHGDCDMLTLLPGLSYRAGNVRAKGASCRALRQENQGAPAPGHCAQHCPEYVGGKPSQMFRDLGYDKISL